MSKFTSAARLTTSGIQSEYSFLMSSAINFSTKCLYCKNCTSQRKFFRATSPVTRSAENTSSNSICHQQKQHKKYFSVFDATQKWNNPTNTSFCVRNTEAQQLLCAAGPIDILKSLFNNCHKEQIPFINW